MLRFFKQVAAQCEIGFSDLEDSVASAGPYTADCHNMLLMYTFICRTVPLTVNEHTMQS
jgi:hypothetical protein